MATLVRFEPFREITALHNEMSRLMNGLLQEGAGNGRTGQSWVPVLELDDGSTVQGSARIIEWAEANPRA